MPEPTATPRAGGADGAAGDPGSGDEAQVPRNPGLARRLERTRFREVRWFTEIDSTNRYLLDEAAAGAPEGLVAVADAQTAGRGRLGRRWEAPPGASLLVSVLLRPALPPERLHLVTVAAAVGAVGAVRALTGIRAGLKWPNDLVVGERKLAGLLAEVLPGPALVVGMGLNVSWESFPTDLAEIATACNLESATPLERPDLLVAWLSETDALLSSLAEDGGAALRDTYLDLSATVGRRVRVDLPARSFEADAVGIDEGGHLLVACDEGGTEVVAAGDVVNLRFA